MTRIHILQHVPFEGPGIISDWAAMRCLPVTYTKFYEEFTLPAHNTYDLLVVMGGPMGVYDEAEYSWLVEEKNFIKKAVSLDKKILGICLGSQLLAECLGAKVFKNKEKEIGFFPINLTTKSNSIFKDFPEEIMVFHWHGDTFDLPKGASLLASSEVTENQAFVVGDNILALQFHFEVTADLINVFLKDAEPELVDASHIQKEQQIKDGFHFLPTCNLLMEELLDNFVK